MREYCKNVLGGYFLTHPV